MSERQQRVARTAKARNMALLWLGYVERVPYCELEGEAAPKARRAYLRGAEIAFTKSDRSMAAWDRKRGGWLLLVEDSWFPTLYATKGAALAAGREAEQRKSLVRPPVVLVAAREWARQRDVSDAMNTLRERVAAGEIR